MTIEEVAVLRAAIDRAALVPIAEGMRGSIEDLSVVGLCECGCRSLYFSEIEGGDGIVADGVGSTADGKHVGIMVWAHGETLTALDIVDFESSGHLPTLESISSFEQSGK